MGINSHPGSSLKLDSSGWGLCNWEDHGHHQHTASVQSSGFEPAGLSSEGLGRRMSVLCSLGWVLPHQQGKHQKWESEGEGAEDVGAIVELYAGPGSSTHSLPVGFFAKNAFKLHPLSILKHV